MQPGQGRLATRRGGQPCPWRAAHRSSCTAGRSSAPSPSPSACAECHVEQKSRRVKAACVMRSIYPSIHPSIHRSIHPLFLLRAMRCGARSAVVAVDDRRGEDEHAKQQQQQQRRCTEPHRRRRRTAFLSMHHHVGWAARGDCERAYVRARVRVRSCARMRMCM